MHVYVYIPLGMGGVFSMWYTGALPNVFKTTTVSYKCRHYTLASIICTPFPQQLIIIGTAVHLECRDEPRRTRREGGKKKKKKGHTAAVFHSVCKYCFLVKLCCESQESIRGSEILREINNMLGFSTTELKVISDPRKHRITIKVVFLYLLLLHFCPWWKTFSQKPWTQTLCRSVQLHSDVHAASR